MEGKDQRDNQQKIKMKYLFTILVLLSSHVLFGQTSFLTEAASKLDKALILKDTVTLKQLLFKELTYGHSNGWVETKDDVVRDVTSGKLSYQEIENSAVSWVTGKSWASMRCTSAVKFSLDGKAAALKLHVLQVWLKTNKGWQLYARQSTKM